MSFPSPAKTACAICVCVATALAATASANAAEAPLALGLQDPIAFQGDLGPDQLPLALAHAKEAGASIIRLGVSWRYIDTSKPPSRDAARNPDWPGYRWGEIDSEVRSVVAAGMKPLLVPVIAPRWFEGPNRPSLDAAPAGTWRPQPAALGDFARAIATRFDGSHHDSNGAQLPRVRYFQAMNETNLSEYLNPQSKGSARTPVSPALYHDLLNSFYASAKAVRPDNFVVAAGLAPYGDYPPWQLGHRTPPVLFARALLCVNPSGSKAHKCPRLYFDAFATHAFPQADPRDQPLNPGDIRLRVKKMTSALRLAAKAGTISDHQARTIWMTELAWDGGKQLLSFADQARFLQLGMYMLWREGVDAVFWYNIRDRTAPVFMWLSGLFTHENSVQHDTPKPAYTGFRFPFVAVRSGGHTLAWGRARSTQDPVIVEQRKGNGGWKQVAKFTVGKGLVYLRTVSSPGNAVLRARQGSLTSLSFQVTTAVP